MPFIEMIESKAKVLELKTIDYRLLNAIGSDTYYYGEDTDSKMRKVWE